MPASNARALEKAKTLPADTLIFDLEDAVAPDAKDAARAQAMAAVTAGGYGARELVVRVNAIDTDWGADDLRAVGQTMPDAVLLPKVENPDRLRTACNMLPDALQVWCMIETPAGVLNVTALASVSQRIGALVAGTSDLSADLNARPGARREPLWQALSMIVLAARARGLTALDGVHLNLEDDEGFAAVCQQGRDFGFDGKTLIHPRQIEPANRIFSPDDADIEEAQVIVDAFEQAEKEGKGMVVVNGRLIEYLHVAEARRLLALADAIAARNAENDAA
jgi:citrate lyase subunit beta/citryl-CoA lyase